jgi:hypothetical protein
MKRLAINVGGGCARRPPEPPERRTLAKVRRFSRPRGKGGYVALGRVQAEDWIWALKRWERRQKRLPKAKIRAVGHIALAVHEYLCRQAVKRKGMLDDLSYARIAAILGFSRSAVVDACRRLAAHGWLKWFRQFVPTGQQGVRGPQVEQTANFYWLELPLAALAKAGIRLGKAPAPDDDLQRRSDASNVRAVQVLAASPLGAALDELGAAIARRRERETDQASHSGVQFKE